MLSSRTAPRTWNPASRSAFTAHEPMKPFAPVTRTLPDEIAGMEGLILLQ